MSRGRHVLDIFERCLCCYAGVLDTFNERGGVNLEEVIHHEEAFQSIVTACFIFVHVGICNGCGLEVTPNPAEMEGMLAKSRLKVCYVGLMESPVLNIVGYVST